MPRKTYTPPKLSVIPEGDDKTFEEMLPQIVKRLIARVEYGNDRIDEVQEQLKELRTDQRVQHELLQAMMDLIRARSSDG